MAAPLSPDQFGPVFVPERATKSGWEVASILQQRAGGYRPKDSHIPDSVPLGVHDTVKNARRRGYGNPN